jgi:Xaa-Pro aminopeptidase
MIHEVRFAGQKWEQKVNALRANFSSFQCDAIVLSSLPEIAYLLNVRGNDVQYLPVFKAYMIISLREIILYVNKNQVDTGVILHLNSHHCSSANCVQ